MTKSLRDWIGHSVTRTDMVTPRLLAEYRATMGPWLFETAEGICPPGMHWGIAPAMRARDETGPDGAEEKGPFLPPIPLPRRMWAGGSITTHRPLAAGAMVTRRSEIADVRFKEGASGPIAILSIRHEMSDEAGIVVSERQDLVFRDAAAVQGVPPLPEDKPPPPSAIWAIEATPLLLFRFSAFTFNGHRIHYDAPYAAAEGYPGLLVHGPLQAALMLNLSAVKLGQVPARFDYRCLAPLYGGQRFSVAWEDAERKARVVRTDGVVTAEATIPARGTA